MLTSQDKDLGTVNFPLQKTLSKFCLPFQVPQPHQALILTTTLPPSHHFSPHSMGADLASTILLKHQMKQTFPRTLFQISQVNFLI